MFSELNWSIGAQVQHLERANSTAPGNSVAAYQLEPMQGVLSQFVSYWTTVPDFTDTAVREKLYNAGPVDLGNMGTSSGLARPNIYLRLQNYRDVEQLGSLAFDTPSAVRWLELTDLDYSPPSQSNVHYLLANDHEGSVEDNFGNGFLAIFDIETQVSGVFLFAIELNSETAFASTITRNRGSAVALTTTATMSTVAQKTATTGSALAAESTLGSVFISRTRDTGSQIASEFAIEATQGFLKLAGAALSSAGTLVCEPTEIEAIQGAAAMTSAFALAADVSNIIFVSASTASEFALSADATVIPPTRADANLTASFSITINGGGIFGSIILEASAGTLSASVNVVRGAQAAITANASTTALAGKFTGIPLTNLQVNGFTLTAGDIINFEPSLTYYVPQETRALMILPESRALEIAQETRSLTLLEG